jgi:dihydrofolate reductase
VRRLTVFNNVSLDGYFVDANGDMRWAHDVPPDDEFDELVAGNARGGGTLVFGRVTYDMMAGYWSSPMAKENDPIVAERMNNLPKIVFSRTMKQADWNNTTLYKGDPATEIRTLKQRPGDDMAILGSGSLVAQLAQEGLIDAIQLVVNPLVLGSGRTMFEGARKPLQLELTGSRAFKNGKVVLSYAPKA